MTRGRGAALDGETAAARAGTARRRGPGWRRARAIAPLVCVAISLASCGQPDVRLARRILETYRRARHAKPLPGSQVIHLALSSPGAMGTGEIAWEGPRYRETQSSGGCTVVRGIQSGKAYFTDEDGVTRVVSEPVLSELTTRSYFWRRAWLFDDLERARIGLGPADAASVSLTLQPRDGNPLLLTFSRDATRLLSARAPGFAVSFRDERHFRDESSSGHSWDAEIRWIGLPIATLPDAQVGGWLARWSAPFVEVALQRSGPAVLVPGLVSGRPARIALDAAEDGPLAVSPDLASRLGTAWASDVLGRRLARGATLDIGNLSFHGLTIQEDPRAARGGADGVVGATLVRETVLELDPEGPRFRLHDPAKWVAPDGFFRVVLDDDGNRPVGVWNRGSRSVRLITGVPLEMPLTLAPEAIRRLGLPETESSASGFRWGAAHLPPLRFGIDRSVDSAWGEDGRISLEMLLKHHAYLDMPRRWVYVLPAAP